MSQVRLLMSKSIVLEALLTSVTWQPPLVRFQMSQVSTVPNLSFPASALALAPGTLSRIHLILVALKYASMMRPVFCLIMSVRPLAFRESQ